MAIGVFLERDPNETASPIDTTIERETAIGGVTAIESARNIARFPAERIARHHGLKAPVADERLAGAPARVMAPFPPGFADRAGVPVRDRALQFRFFGNPAGPRILALGGISANADVANSEGQLGWWGDFARSGGGLDLDRYCVIGVDYFPLIDPASGPEADVEADAYTFETGDYARAIVFGLRSLGITHLAAVIGGSFGGMIAQAIAAQAPDFLDRLVILCASARTAPLAHAWRRQQWEAIRLAMAAGQPARGVSLAREIAIATYRSEVEFNERFANRAAITGYLDHHGRKHAQNVSAPRYLALSVAVDSHDVDPAAILTPTLVIAADTDRLVPLDDAKALARSIAGPAELTVIGSRFGHDSFLKDTADFAPVVRAFLNGDD